MNVSSYSRHSLYTDGIVTEEDLGNYTAPMKSAIQRKLLDGATVYSARPPSSGVINQYILNILKGYQFNQQSISGTDNAILTWHRITEAFKFGFAKRTRLGDPDAETDDFKANISNVRIIT